MNVILRTSNNSADFKIFCCSRQHCAAKSRRITDTNNDTNSLRLISFTHIQNGGWNAHFLPPWSTGPNEKRTNERRTNGIPRYVGCIRASGPSRGNSGVGAKEVKEINICTIPLWMPLGTFGLSENGRMRCTSSSSVP